MTDYTNPKVMKGIVNKAKDAGIFKVGKNKRKITNTYLLKLDEENAMRLDMIKREKSYGYKLVQIDFEMGLTSLINPLRTSIKERGKKWFRYRYEIEIVEIKDYSSRAWDGVRGGVLTLYFKSKSGFIEQINTTRGKK